ALSLESVLGLDRLRATILIFRRMLRRITITPDGHWTWRGAHTHVGVAHLSCGGQVQGAARILYVLAEGDVPPRSVVARVCSGHRCINPAHHRLKRVGGGGRRRGSPLVTVRDEIVRRRAAGERVVALAE